MCFNCDGVHAAKDCRRTKTCSTCKCKHHVFLYQAFSTGNGSAPTAQQTSPVSTVTQTTEMETSSGAEVMTASLSSRSAVLLGTATIMCTSSSGRTLQARAQIDPGSEICCATESLRQRLRVYRSPEAISIIDVGGNKSYSNGSTLVTVSSFFDKRCVFQVQVFILPKLTSYTPKS